MVTLALDYQTSAFQTKHCDAILLPTVQTKGMVKRSSARNHHFNECVLSLTYFRFRQLLQAKRGQWQVRRGLLGGVRESHVRSVQSSPRQARECSTARTPLVGTRTRRSISCATYAWAHCRSMRRQVWVCTWQQLVLSFAGGDTWTKLSWRKSTQMSVK